MNHTQRCLEDEQLRQLMTGELAEPDLGAAEEHLSTCDRCRRLLDEAIAAADWWQEARESLSTGICEPSDHEDTFEDLLALLGPTDDPAKLGRIANYEIVGILGRGGMGVVIKGFDPPLNRYVAIKMLLPQLATSGAARKRFAREALAAAAVVDDHVMAIHCVDEWQGVPYLVMPYAKGVSLQKRLSAEGPLELREILRIGLQAAKGLAAAHAQGLVHRDVKPANILLADGVERVSLTDFGLARAVDDASVTRTGVIAGTPQYMSPEQARAQPVDSRSDLFSLGSVLYAMCTGRAPFRAETSYGVLRLITDHEPPSIRDLNAEIPDWLSRLIARLMAKSPDARFASAREVSELLEQCLAHVQQPTSALLPDCLLSVEIAQTTTTPSILIRWRTVLMSSIVAIGLICGLTFATSPPDIGGKWTGEDWGEVELLSAAPGEYVGTYTDTFGDTPGKLRLAWSRLENRYRGSWEEGDVRFGEISVRLVNGEIRGAMTTDAKSKIEPATPRLADLSWQRVSNKASPEKSIQRRGSGSDFGQAQRAQTLRELQGTWQMTASVDPVGTVADEGHVKAVSYVIRDNTFEFHNADDPTTVAKTRFTLDASQSPVKFEFIDYTTKDKDGNARRMVGLLTVEDDTLTICWGASRPDKLAAAKGISYAELRRAQTEQENEKKDAAPVTETPRLSR